MDVLYYLDTACLAGPYESRSVVYEGKTDRLPESEAVLLLCVCIVRPTEQEEILLRWCVTCVEPATSSLALCWLEQR